MRSSDRSRAIDLDQDLPTTEEDVAALRRVSALTSLDLDGYLRFLAELPAPRSGVPRSRRRPRSVVPFELPAKESDSRIPTV
jgi:hypothetical protein